MRELVRQREELGGVCVAGVEENDRGVSVGKHKPPELLHLKGPICGVGEVAAGIDVHACVLDGLAQGANRSIAPLAARPARHKTEQVAHLRSARLPVIFVFARADEVQRVLAAVLEIATQPILSGKHLVDDVVKLRAWVDGRRCVQRPIVGNLQGQAGNIVLVEVRYKDVRCLGKLFELLGRRRLALPINPLLHPWGHCVLEILGRLMTAVERPFDNLGIGCLPHGTPFRCV